jgi:hypothetical protein
MLAMAVGPHSPVIGLSIQVIAIREQWSARAGVGVSAAMFAGFALLMLMRSLL